VLQAASRANARASQLDVQLAAERFKRERANVLTGIDEAVTDGRILYAEAEPMVIACKTNPTAVKELLEARAPDHAEARRNFSERIRTESAEMKYDKDAVAAMYHLPPGAVL
jgi:hypothetical protein